jgi:magnesium transporter
MAPAEADDVRQLSRYAADTAGGMMVTEYLAYADTVRVADVLEDLRAHADEYSRYNVQYAYVTAGEGKLVGVLRLRDLLLSPPATPVRLLMLVGPQRVPTDAPLDELLSFFDRHPYFGVPAVDADGRLVGVVRRADIEEAAAERAGRTLLRFSGVIGGEEFRTMPLGTRVLRRLPWLGVTGVLNLVAAAIIGLYEDTLTAAIALAAFLPVISGLSGNAGNQAVAVSLRELALGLVKADEVWWAFTREAAVGAVNGLVLGLVLAGAALAWKGNPYLGLVVGGSLALSTLVAVCLGGTIPLALKRLGVDPALASGPILTTVTDMCGFFLALSFATAVLHRLGP